MKIRITFDFDENETLALKKLLNKKKHIQYDEYRALVIQLVKSNLKKLTHVNTKEF